MCTVQLQRHPFKTNESGNGDRNFSFYDKTIALYCYEVTDRRQSQIDPSVNQ